MRSGGRKKFACHLVIARDQLILTVELAAVESICITIEGVAGEGFWKEQCGCCRIGAGGRPGQWTEPDEVGIDIEPIGGGFKKIGCMGLVGEHDGVGVISLSLDDPGNIISLVPEDISDEIEAGAVFAEAMGGVEAGLMFSSPAMSRKWTFFFCNILRAV